MRGGGEECRGCDEGLRDQRGAEFNKETALKITVLQSAGPGPEAPEAPAGGQGRKQCGMRGVLKNVASSTQTAFPLDVLRGWKWSPYDALGCFHHPL